VPVKAAWLPAAPQSVEEPASGRAVLVVVVVAVAAGMRGLAQTVLLLPQLLWTRGRQGMTTFPRLPTGCALAGGALGKYNPYPLIMY
jgi:hypothetical protein